MKISLKTKKKIVDYKNGAFTVYNVNKAKDKQSLIDKLSKIVNYITPECSEYKANYTAEQRKFLEVFYTEKIGEAINKYEDFQLNVHKCK